MEAPVTESSPWQALHVRLLPTPTSMQPPPALWLDPLFKPTFPPRGSALSLLLCQHVARGQASLPSGLSSRCPVPGPAPPKESQDSSSKLQPGHSTEAHLHILSIHPDYTGTAARKFTTAQDRVLFRLCFTSLPALCLQSSISNLGNLVGRKWSQ